MTYSTYPSNKLYSLIQFNEISGDLINGHVMTLKGSSIFASVCIVKITKSWMRPEQPRHGFNEGLYYLQHKNDYYLIDIFCNGKAKPDKIVNGKFLKYYEYGIPPHVYTSIIGSLISDI